MILPPIPNTPLFDDPIKDSLFKRWLQEVFGKIKVTEGSDQTLIASTWVGDHRPAQNLLELKLYNDSSSILANQIFGA